MYVCSPSKFRFTDMKFRCGFKLWPSFCPESNNTIQVSEQPLALRNLHLNLILTVPNNYIGAISSCMFGGMMFGAVGWGTCEYCNYMSVKRRKIRMLFKVPTSWDAVQLSMLHSSLQPCLDFSLPVPIHSCHWGLCFFS